MCVRKQENYKNIAFPSITPEELESSEVNEKATVDELVRGCCLCAV